MAENEIRGFEGNHITSEEHMENLKRIRERMAENWAGGFDIKALSNELAEVERESIASLSESAFVRAYLPFFAGDKENPYKANIASWLGVAAGRANKSGLAGTHSSSSFRRVAIVSDQTGEVLFTVPPVSDNYGISVVPHNNVDSVENIGITFSQESAMSPRMADRNYRDRLANMVASAQVNMLAETISYLQEWNAIFNRYGRPLIPLTDADGKDISLPEGVVSKTQGAGEVKSSQAGPAGDYEDL